MYSETAMFGLVCLLGVLSAVMYHISKRWGVTRSLGPADLDRLLLDNLDTFDRTAARGVVTKHPSSPSPLNHDSNHSRGPDSTLGVRKPQLSGYQTARFSNRPRFDDMDDVQKDAENEIRDIARDLKSELIRDSEKMLQDIETLYEDHISHYEGDFVTKSDELCDALSKIDALNIKEENKQFLIRSMDNKPYYNPLEPPKYHVEPNKIDLDSEKHSTLKTLMAKRRQFGTGPPSRIFDKVEPTWKPTSQVKSPPLRDHSVEVVKGETVDAYADYKRGAMSPQERVMENIKNLREGDDDVHQVMPSKAKMPHYAPQEQEEPVQRPRGVFTRRLLDQKSAIREPPKPMMLPDHATPGPFTYMNSTAPIADLADIKAQKRKSNEPTNPDVSDDVPLTNGVKRGSVKNLAAMFNRCMSPDKGDRRERHKSECFPRMSTNLRPLTRSRSLVFDEDKTEGKSIRTCISTNDLTCSTKYDDNTDRDVDTSIMDDTADSKLFNDRMLIHHNYSHGVQNGDDMDVDDCPSSASLSRAVSPVQMVRRHKDYKNKAAKKAAEDRRMRFSINRNTSVIKSDESVRDSPELDNDNPQISPPKTYASNFSTQIQSTPRKFERKARFSNYTELGAEDAKLLSTIISEPTPLETSPSNGGSKITPSTHQNGTPTSHHFTTTRASSLTHTEPPVTTPCNKPSPVTSSVLTTSRIPTSTKPVVSTTASVPTSVTFITPSSHTPRQTVDTVKKTQLAVPKDPPSYKNMEQHVNFDMSKPPTFYESDAASPDQPADLNSSQSSSSSLKENDCLNQYRVEVSRNRITEEESLSSGKEIAAEPLSLVSNQKIDEKIPFSITEYQEMFKEKQKQKQPASPVGSTRKRFTRQSTFTPPNPTTQHSSPRTSFIRPRGIVKSSSVQEGSRVGNQAGSGGGGGGGGGFMGLINQVAPKNPVKRAQSVAAPGSAQSKKQALLHWCKRMTEGKAHVDIKNFSSSWNNGMAFCALFHHFIPDQIPYDTLDPKNREYNFRLAFTEGEKAGVTALLDVEDMVDMKNPEWMSVMTYVSLIYNHFNGIRVGGPRLPPMPGQE